MDKYKFEQEELQLVQDTALTAAEIDHHVRGGKFSVTTLDHEEGMKAVRDHLNNGKKPMKEHNVAYGRIQLLKAQLSYLEQACAQALAKFNNDEKMSNTIPYEFHVTEKEVRFNMTLLEYRYLNVKHSLQDIKDEVKKEGKEVDYAKQRS